MVLTRQQFVDRFTVHGERPDSPLWIPEVATNCRCDWFVCCSPLGLHGDQLADYHHWNEQNLQAPVLCFSSGEFDEWYGFVEYDDIAWWMMKWL